jgi:hypothetical protein
MHISSLPNGAVYTPTVFSRFYRNLRASLFRRLGLTCRYWYRGVWALQSHLNVTSLDAGVSLAKRKFIKEDTINSITIQEISYKTTFEPFLDRFVHRAPNLKRLTFWNPLSLRNDCVFHRIMFEFCGPKLEDICVGSRLKQDIDTALPQMWQVYRDIPLAPFKEALKKFHIGLRMTGGDTLAPLRACPNLEHVSFPETTFSTSTFTWPDPCPFAAAEPLHFR